MRWYRFIAAVAGVAAASAPWAARAYDQYETQTESTINVEVPPEQSPDASVQTRVQVREPATYDYRLSPMGAALMVGGGVQDFANDRLTDVTDPGGFWNVRAVLGTRTVMGLEVAYIGSAQDVELFGLDKDAVLLSNGFEGNLRLNLPFTREGWLVGPYAFGGVGWVRYDVVNDDFNTTASLNNADDIAIIPVGGGFGMSYLGFAFDARFTYRAAFDEELLRGRDNGLDTWTVSANIGAEF